MPTFGSLFAGIGGIDLGLERAGWTGRWQVEWDDYCQRVLAKHWPDIPRYGDITTVDWSTVEPVDLLAGGFPCQPVSFAGKLRAQGDVRWLWPEFRRAIRELRPGLVLVENVPGLLARGMGDVLGDLATLGYDTEWDCVPAAAVGAVHLRDRVWIVAHDDGRNWRASGPSEVEAGPTGHSLDGRASDSWSTAVPDADSGRRQVERISGLFDGFRETFRDDADGRGSAMANAASDGWITRRTSDAPQESRGRQPHRGGIGADVGDAYGPSEDAHAETGGSRRTTGEPGWWATEPDVGRVADGVPARVDRLRSLGNAVVPQVVEVIGRALLEVTA